jgi:hypothetical protein
MSTDISIVIQGVDRFSPAFDQLDDALGRIEKSSAAANRSLSGLDTAFAGFGAGAEGAERAAADFAARLSEQFGALVEGQGAAAQDLSARQEEAVATLHDRLLELEQQTAERRLTLERGTNERLYQERAAHQARMVQAVARQEAQLLQYEAAAQETRLAAIRTFESSLLVLVQSQGRSLAQFAKTLAVSQALMDTYLAANAALAQVPYPFNFAVAAAVTAQGLANVQRIQQIAAAHGGLDFVPSEQTYLLAQGERVLSPKQNQDLTQFLGQQGAGGGGGPVTIQNLTVHVLENATTGQSLLNLDRAVLRQVVAERIIPALDELARLGVRPAFVAKNT